MDSYEAMLRLLFPAFYRDALEICQDEEDAAVLAQSAILRLYEETPELPGASWPASDDLGSEESWANVA